LCIFIPSRDLKEIMMELMKTFTALLVILLGFVANIHCIPPVDDTLVRIDLFVMALCPDAYVCETTYAPVISQVGSIVDLHLNYIANVTSSKHAAVSDFSCMHGPNECVGDTQQLCAYYYDSSRNYTWWNFVQCQDASQDNIPYNGESCAQQVGLNYKLLSDCSNGSLGVDLFTKSIETTNQAGVDVSCTIYIQNQLFCVHNGDWQNCKTHEVSQIVAYICQQYKGPNPPPACSSPAVMLKK